MGTARVRFVVLVLISTFLRVREGRAATFTFVNRCTGTVWPGIQSNAGSSRLDTTGFVLPPGTSRAVPAPSGWSGRVWARTGCGQDGSGKVVCATGDCGSGSLECNGQNAATPATLAEFTLASAGGNDFYDVSLVDGYNLPILVEPAGGAATGASATTCAAAGCTADLNERCPAELRAEGGAGCRSACDAFGRPEYCCSGAYANPNTCRPTAYSQLFKSACPNSYSYAYDDPTSTFTCAGGRDYTITFCPVATPSVKSSSGPGAATTTAAPTGPTPTLPGATPRSAGGGPEGQGVMLGDNSWLASLATGDASSAPALRALPLAPLLLVGLLLLVLL
ncbi:thaumatin-like protein 1 precursor [Zea mays]|uniref:Thaumatin-like protein 1 n=1 Tax=Zea mays TaxID=4577 RepID=B6TEB6_MAIZE|nr:thaumatin-like protein 1 precursor [Zea mays]ACG35449.1 thaumatin-like protein 1 precursor [Zea mays]ONL95896.1 Thaumatin-like protein 1 [Zea mays]|eukprot:NP_001149439.1 thaumatin-like protein 1 precursor [Zea mays]